jgi:hypothetical protein
MAEEQIEAGDLRSAIKSLERVRSQAMRHNNLDGLRALVSVSELASERARERREQRAATDLSGSRISASRPEADSCHVPAMKRRASPQVG